MNQFDLKSFIEAVSNSTFINTLHAEEASRVKWLLFNAPEELKQTVFEMFMKENELSSKIFNEALGVTISYLKQYNDENKALNSKLLGKIAELNEVRARKNDKSSGEYLLNSL